MYDRILDSLVQRIKDYTTSKRFLRTRIAIGQPWEGEPRVLIEFHDPEKNLKSEQLMSIVDVYASSLKQALPVYVKEVEDLSHYQRQYKFFMHLRDAEEGEVKSLSNIDLRMFDFVLKRKTEQSFQTTY
jgi:hypothetical protein